MPLSNAKMKNPILPKINTESLILPQNPISTEVSCLLPEFQAALDVLPKSLVYTFSKLRSLQIDIDEEAEEVYSLFHGIDNNNDHDSNLPHYLATRISDCLRLGQRKKEIAAQAFELVDYYLQQVNEELKKDGMVIENLEPSPVPSPLASLSLSKSSSPKNKDTPKKTWKRGPKKANKKGNHVVELEPTMTLSVPEPQELAPSTELESMLDSDLEKEVEPPLVEPVNVPEPGLESELEKGNGPEPETFSTVHNPATMIDPLEKDIDPEDSVYCFCRRPAFFGDMVGCDSMQSCAYEWFHLECVKLRKAPKGRWFCDDCLKKKDKCPPKKRKRK